MRICTLCARSVLCHCVFFFFQAEDGIRDKLVTGVQTCALPIFHHHRRVISLLNHSAMMVDAAYDELYRAMKPGMSENQAVGLASKVLYDLGSEYEIGRASCRERV